MVFLNITIWAISVARILNVINFAKRISVASLSGYHLLQHRLLIKSDSLELIFKTYHSMVIFARLYKWPRGHH